MPDNFDFPDLGPNKDKCSVLIGPKGNIFGRDLVISEQFVNNAIAGRGKVYIWGWAEYNDIFENTIRHRTEFCNEIIISSIESDKVRIEFRIHTKHNGADEQCLKKPIT